MSNLAYFIFCLTFLISCNCQTTQVTSLPFLHQVKSTNHNSDLINRLAFSFINKAGDSNIIFSPISIQLILSIVLLGARGESYKQILKVCGYQRRVMSDYHTFLKQTLENLVMEDESSDMTIDIINTVLVQYGFNISQKYTENLLKFYNVELNEVDFEQHPMIIFQWANKWVKFKTQNKIEKILDEPPSPSTLMMIINAAYFKGTWQHQFDQNKTRLLPFYSNYAEKKFNLVPFMMLKTKVKFAETFELKAIQLPYSGGKIEMILLLPKAKNEILQLQKSLSTNKLNNIINLLVTKEVKIELPKFELKEIYDLKSILPELGIVDIFDQSKANLSRIEETGILYVNKAIHKAKIEINEKGTEASAVGLISASVRIGNDHSSYFTADHPFIFIIREIKSNVIFFMGRVSYL